MLTKVHCIIKRDNSNEICVRLRKANLLKRTVITLYILQGNTNKIINFQHYTLLFFRDNRNKANIFFNAITFYIVQLSSK